MHHEEEKPRFKVVDKRGMTDEDHGCCGGHHHNEEPKAKEKLKEEAESKTRPPMSFSLFVQSLAHQAMMGLGIAPWPDSETVKIELPLAKETIDILAMLKEKSKGNLDKDEQLMLDSVLYQLQVAFVEIAKSSQGDSPIIK